MSNQNQFRDELPEDAPKWAHMINRCLKENGMTQATLAKKAKVSEPTITGWLKKGAEPKIQGFIAVADALDVSVDYLLGLIPDNVSKRADVSAVEYRLGLTKTAQNNLRVFHDSSDGKPSIYINLINYCLENPIFYDLLLQIFVYSQKAVEETSVMELDKILNKHKMLAQQRKETESSQLKSDLEEMLQKLQTVSAPSEETEKIISDIKQKLDVIKILNKRGEITDFNMEHDITYIPRKNKEGVYTLEVTADEARDAMLFRISTLAQELAKGYKNPDLL